MSHFNNRCSSCTRSTTVAELIALAHLQRYEGGDRAVARELGQRGVIAVTQSQQLLARRVRHQGDDMSDDNTCVFS